VESKRCSKVMMNYEIVYISFILCGLAAKNAKLLLLLLREIHFVMDKPFVMPHHF
jgi:hypothetical protein